MGVMQTGLATGSFFRRVAVAGMLMGVFALSVAACSPQAETDAAGAEASETPVILFNILPLRPDALEAFLPVMRANVAGSREEEGNVSFDVYRLESGGDDLFLVERWRDQAALDTHMETPHLQAVAGRLATDLRSPEISQRLIELSSTVAREPVPSPSGTRNLVVSLSVRPEARATFVEALLSTVAPSRAAPGNIEFDVYQDAADPNELVIVERWASVVAHETHLEQPYNAPLNAIFEQSLARPLGEGRRLLSDVSED